jgi:hypothetical protein
VDRFTDRRVSRGDQFAVMPPSITNSLPVTQAASSDAKYRQPSAMSDGLPNRPKGVASIPALSLTFSKSPGRANGVSTNPGCTEFTRIRSFAYCSAADLRKSAPHVSMRCKRRCRMSRRFRKSTKC